GTPTVTIRVTHNFSFWWRLPQYLLVVHNGFEFVQEVNNLWPVSLLLVTICFGITADRSNMVNTRLSNSQEEVTVEVRDAAPTHYLLKLSPYFQKVELTSMNQMNLRLLAINGTGSLPAGWEVNVTVTFVLFNQLCNNYFTVRVSLQNFMKTASVFIPSSLNGDFPNFFLIKYFKRPDTLFTTNVPSEQRYWLAKTVDLSEWEKKKRIKHIQRQAVGECLSMVKSNNSFKREWKIRNFSNLGVDWMSEEFTAADHKWIIKLQPKGTVHHEEYQVSIYLCSVDFKNFDPNQKVKANCSICINDQIKGWRLQTIFNKFHIKLLQDEYHYSDSKAIYTWFATTKNVRGYPQFIPLTQLLDNKKSYIVNDCIAVEIEFTHRVKSLVILD
ncbi:hypothetical protein H5410_056792, partial [Solanum commersonii]